jgi:hypothetical protein
VRIVAFGQIGQIPNHGEADPVQIDRSDAQGLQEVIAVNIAENDRRTGFRGIFLELKQH